MTELITLKGIEGYDLTDLTVNVINQTLENVLETDNFLIINECFITNNKKIHYIHSIEPEELEMKVKGNIFCALKFINTTTKNILDYIRNDVVNYMSTGAHDMSYDMFQGLVKSFAYLGIAKQNIITEFMQVLNFAKPVNDYLTNNKSDVPKLIY